MNPSLPRLIEGYSLELMMLDTSGTFEETPGVKRWYEPPEKFDWGKWAVSMPLWISKIKFGG